MLHLQAPRGVLQITNDEEPAADALKIANPLGWMRAMTNHKQQAEQYLRQLMEACGDTVG